MSDPPVDPRDEEFSKLKRLIATCDEDAAIAYFDQHPDLIDYCNPQSGTPLGLATGHGLTRLAAFLLDHGANPSQLNYWGQSPLELCLFGAQTTGRDGEADNLRPVDKAFELLLDHGSDPFARKSPHVQVRTEHGVTAETDLLDFGIALQQSPADQCIQRNVMLAALRARRGLPVDAMLPVNADSLYLPKSD